MLVTTNRYKPDQIISLKLVNGDEVVAKLVEETATDYIVSKPTTVMPSQQGIGLMQSLFTSDLNTNITISKSHVMMNSPTISEMENHYIHTTTGIEPVTAGSIIQ